ncbi:hypothetical protein ABZ702_34385 [Streptomyces cyaneofuscatus]|uniref:hypothetical protein n=1 Tax=Streptomyces cyaneofuscatus TaxID=66883 RepID=UPI003406A796
MTSHHSIFIHPGLPEETLTADVAAASGARLRRVAHGPVDYGADLGDTALEIELSHDYEEDMGIPFDRYQVVVTVRDFEGHRDREQARAEHVFNRLADVRRYWLVLVFDLQTVIATAAPPKQEVFPHR